MPLDCRCIIRSACLFLVGCAPIGPPSIPKDRLFAGERGEHCRHYG